MGQVRADQITESRMPPFFKEEEKEAGKDLKFSIRIIPKLCLLVSIGGLLPAG